MARIAIVGAGISGLSCAWHLGRLLPDARIDVLESSVRVGGVIQTHYESPMLVEMGADNLASLIPDGINMIREMGLRDEFISPNPEHRFAQVVRAGRIYPIPNGFSLMQPTKMGAILTSPILSLSGKLRVLGEFFIPKRNDPADESVESFAVRRLGRECFDRLVEPIVGGIFTARAETLSMNASMPQFVEMEQKSGGLIRGAIAKRKSETKSDSSARKANGARYDQFIAPKQGMSWWMEQIASQLPSPVLHGISVESVTLTEHGKWHIRCNDDSINGASYDMVCLSTPSWVSSKIIRTSNPLAADHLDRIPYASSAVAVLAIRKAEIDPRAMCFGVVIPKTENRNTLAISLTSEKYPGRCPDDTVLARVFMGGAVRPELVLKSDSELLDIATREVQELLGVSSKPSWQKLVRWDQAMPQYLTGHLDRVKRIRELLAETPNLHVIGNAFDGVGIPQCIRLARTTAETMAAAAKTLLLLCCFGLLLLSKISSTHASGFEAAEHVMENGMPEIVRRAFQVSHDGWSVDEVLLRDDLRQKFLMECRRLATKDLDGTTDREILEQLVKLRKSNKLNVETTQRERSDLSDYLVSAEIASRYMHDAHGVSPDQWLVDPELLREFDKMGLSIANTENTYLLRKAALKLRKSRSLRPELLQRVTDWDLEIETHSLGELKEKLATISESPGVYIFRDNTGYLYIGQASDLRKRLKTHLTESDRKALSTYLESEKETVTVELHVFGPHSPARKTIVREAYESELIRSRKPRLNLAP
ncbi:MAG: protoporphyrinogen oxidase [Pirellula sp.]|nr:protoporphyrinogen oxidase [Pirellula sp.]